MSTTVEPPCATTSRKSSPPISDRQSKNDFPSESLTVGTSSKRSPPVSDRDHFLGLTVNDFPLFLTSCKGPLDAFSGLYFRCVHYATQTTWNYTWRYLEIASNKIIFHEVDALRPLLGRDPLWFNS